MSHRVAVVALTTVVIAGFSAAALSQQVRVPGAEYDSDFPNEKPEPAPRRDLSGIWEPARGPGDAIQATGAKNMPDSGQPQHALPFTPAGLKANLANKPAWGPRMVPSALSNDPQPTCEPQGFPRILLHNYRTAQIFQNPKQVLVAYQFNRKWRNIWTDGRALPTVDDFLEPRWWGYSVGRWQDDYTLVVDSVGMDERTWLDNVGRPHSFEMRVQERYFRRDLKHLDVTVTIDDPVYYSRPWVALDRLPLRLQPDTFDIREMECSPSEFARYTKEFAEPAAGVQDGDVPR
jgi:hypothetical protein